MLNKKLTKITIATKKIGSYENGQISPNTKRKFDIYEQKVAAGLSYLQTRTTTRKTTRTTTQRNFPNRRLWDHP